MHFCNYCDQSPESRPQVPLTPLRDRLSRSISADESRRSSHLRWHFPALARDLTCNRRPALQTWYIHQAERINPEATELGGMALACELAAADAREPPKLQAEAAGGDSEFRRAGCRTAIASKCAQQRAHSRQTAWTRDGSADLAETLCRPACGRYWQRPAATSFAGLFCAVLAAFHSSPSGQMAGASGWSTIQAMNEQEPQETPNSL